MGALCCWFQVRNASRVYTISDMMENALASGEGISEQVQILMRYTYHTRWCGCERRI